MKSALLAIGMLIATITLATTFSSAFAQGGICQELWVERNSIYKERGYCFKTERAISYFGNAGCRYDSESDVPLSESQRARIEQIRRRERENGCQ
jgi:hypothetical protein